MSGPRLPPGVIGQERGELHCRLGSFKLRARKQGDADQPLLASFTFWGQKGPGYALKIDHSSSASTARFPISCGPKGFIRYLHDMQSLVIHVEEAYSHLPLGKAIIDVTLLTEKQPIRGTFPLLMPRDQSGAIQAGGSTSDGVSAALGSLGSDLTHVGSFDLHMELGFFASASLRSFEAHEHLASQTHHSGGMISHPPISFPSKPKEESSDHQAVGDFNWDMSQLDLFELLLNRLLLDFKTFCEVFDAWKAAPPPLKISKLLSRMQSHRVFQYETTREQMQYLQVMIDPKGELEEISIDDFILAVRQSVEAGVRVRSRLEMQPVMMMLAPLAQNIQQALTLLRQAFRDSSFEGESGLMTMEMLSSVLQELLPPIKTQQLRYLTCILAHQGSSGRHGVISFQDVQAFLRMASSSVSKKDTENTADAMADSDSPADVAAYILSGIPAKAAKSIADGRFGKVPVAVEGQIKPQIVKKGALDRLKDQRPQVNCASEMIESDQELEGASSKPLLHPFPPPLPVFLEINPPLPTQAPAPPPEPSRKEGNVSKVASDALDLLIQKAEALQNALADASMNSPQRKKMEDEDDISHISMLRFVSDPDIALDFAKDTLMMPRATDERKRMAKASEAEALDDEGSLWKEQDLLHHLFFPASVDTSLDLTDTGRDEPDPHPEAEVVVDAVLVNAATDQDAITADPPIDDTSRQPFEQQVGASKPGLHIVIHDALLPRSFKLDPAQAGLSLVARSSCLMPAAQGIHWPISARLEGGDPSCHQPLLSLTLPIHHQSSLPCQVALELWSDKSTLVGVSQVRLSCQEEGNQVQAKCLGEFPMTNPLLMPEEEEELAQSSRLKIEARIVLSSTTESTLELSSIRSIQHTFRVTVCQVIDAALSSPLPLSRFVSYLYPGDSDPLCTEEIPGKDPMFAASVAHSLTLLKGEDVASNLINAAREAQAGQAGFDGRSILDFGLWERWSDDEEPLLAASTTLPLSSLAELAFASRSISDAGLCSSVGTFIALPLDDAAKDDTRLLIQLQYDITPSQDPLDEEIDNSAPTISPSPSPKPAQPADAPPRFTALVTVDVIQATGLAAAVLEAQAWLGSSAALLGRSHLTGPSPYVTIELISGGLLKGRFPKLQTPFLIHSSCPRFNHQSQLELPLDSSLLEALATQHLCIEVWHHTSRALASETADSEGSKVQDILLGCATCPLSSILLKPTGINSWLVVKSQRGEPVGAVQVAVSIEALRRFSQEGGQEVVMVLPLDACSDSAPPLMQHPEILAGPMLPPAAREHLTGLAPWAFALTSRAEADSPPEPLSDGIWPAPSTDRLSSSLPQGFGGQWCRLTLHLDQLVLPSPGAAAEFRPKSYKYYASYKLPGAYNVDIETAAQTAKAQQVSSSSPSSPITSWVVPLSHCGIHWVRADSSLAAALARAPLLLRVFRVYGKTTGLLAAKPQQGTGGDSHAETWLSCTLVGECTVDLSSMISSSAIRKHQPNTRWLSGTFSLIEPESKVFANNRIQVRSLLELLPSTLPPLTWLSKSAWQPVMAPNPAPLVMEQEQPATPLPLSEPTADPDTRPFSEDMATADNVQGGTVLALVEGNSDLVKEIEETNRVDTAPFSQSGIQPSATDHFSLNDYLFSFSRGEYEEVPQQVADALLNPTILPDLEADDLEPEGTADMVQTAPSDGKVLSAVLTSLAPGSPSHLSGSSDALDMASDKAMLRRQLQELELMSMGFRSRFESPEDPELMSITTPQEILAFSMLDQQANFRAMEKEEEALDSLPLIYAPRVNKTCSEDGDDLFVLGGDSGSDSDDTDELLAKASGAQPGIRIEHIANAPTLFSSALDPDLVFSFARPSRRIAAPSSPSSLSLSTHPVPQFLAWEMGQQSALAPLATAAEYFFFPSSSDSDTLPLRVGWEPPSQAPRFTFSNALPGLQPDFKLEYSG